MKPLDDGKRLSWGFSFGDITTKSVLRINEKGEWTELAEITIGTRPPQRLMELVVRRQSLENDSRVAKRLRIPRYFDASTLRRLWGAFSAKLWILDDSCVEKSHGGFTTQRLGFQTSHFEMILQDVFTLIVASQQCCNVRDIG